MRNDPTTILAFVLIPAALLFAGWLVNKEQLWSFLGNLTLPWLCTSVAISILLLGAVSLIMGVPPASIPIRTSFAVVAVVLGVLGIGMAIDAFSYGESRDRWLGVFEWLGFALILIATFLLPHIPANLE